MIFFTADLHLGHANIIRHCNRPFESAVEMDATLIDNINEIVGEDDELWVLGDFAWRDHGRYQNWLSVRNLHFLAGNHDSKQLNLPNTEHRVFNKVRFHLSHYPHVSWRGSNHGSIHLYGHCHGTMEKTLNTIWPDRKSMDVGVDCNGYKPVSLDQILKRFA